MIKKKKTIDNKFNSRKLFYIFAISLALSTFLFIFLKNWLYFFFIFSFSFFIILFGIYAKIKLEESARISKIEEVFPDFLQMVSSNLRAGMTIERSLLLSARKEFHPLDLEIINLGKDLVTGKELTKALEEMADRIGSEKIKKTISLIISGIISGGNLSMLLKQIADNLRQRSFLEKRASSNVLMYVIFIFFAVAIGAPVLFSLSTIMVQVMSNLFSNMPSVDLNVSSNLPFKITRVNISTSFVVWFSMIFILMIDIFASFILGIVSKGKEQQGLKFLVPLIIISLVVFFSLRILLMSFFKGIF